MSKNELSPQQREELLITLKVRFEKNMNRHKGLAWTKVQAKLDSPAGGGKLWSLSEMEKTGGEPDVIDYHKRADEYIFLKTDFQRYEKFFTLLWRQLLF